jgi:hypothetical protein
LKENAAETAVAPAEDNIAVGLVGDSIVVVLDWAVDSIAVAEEDIVAEVVHIHKVVGEDIVAGSDKTYR